MPNFPASEEPCYDGCTCEGCWTGWTTQTKKSRAMARLEAIVEKSDGDDESIYVSRKKFEDVVDWLLDPTKGVDNAPRTAG